MKTKTNYFDIHDGMKRITLDEGRRWLRRGRASPGTVGSLQKTIRWSNAFFLHFFAFLLFLSFSCIFVRDQSGIRCFHWDRLTVFSSKSNPFQDRDTYVHHSTKSTRARSFLAGVARKVKEGGIFIQVTSQKIKLERFFLYLSFLVEKRFA